MNDNENENSMLFRSEDVCNIDSVIVCGADMGNVGAVSLKPDDLRTDKDQECCIPLWKDDLRGSGSHIPCIKFHSASKVVFVGIKGRFYAFNPITGERQWKVHPKSQQGIMSSMTSEWCDLFIAHQNLFSTQIGRLMKISFDGQLVWDVDLHLGSKYAVCTLAAPNHENLIFVGVKRTVICVNSSSGDIVWKIKLPNEKWGGISFATNSTKYLVAAVDGIVYSLNYSNGEIVNHKQMTSEGKPHLTPVSLAHDPCDDNVFYAACATQLVAFNMVDGALLQVWTSKIKNQSSYCLPILVHVEDNKTKSVIVASSSHVRGFHPKTGELLWTSSLNVSFATRAFSTIVDFSDTTLVCATPNHLVGINKNTGEQEWEDKMKGWAYPHAMFLATARHSTSWSSAPIMHAILHSNMDAQQ